MTSELHGLVVGVLLVMITLILIPMVPGGLIDTRDFSPLPRWQYNLFNVFLTSLGLASFVTAGFAIAAVPWAFVAAIVLGLLYVAVFALDLAKIFPVVPDHMPVQLLVLEVIDLALAGALAVIAVRAVLL